MDLEEKRKIKDVISDINLTSYQLFKEILTLNIERSLKIITLLLNNSILFNFFSGMIRKDQAIKIIKGDNEAFKDKNLVSLEIDMKSKEIFLSTCLYILLNYENEGSMGKSATDSKISNLYENDEHQKVTEDFLICNSSSPELPLNFIKKLNLKVDYLPLPNLIFDPLYMEIKRHPAFKHLNSFMVFGQVYTEDSLHFFEYHPNPELFKEYFAIFDNENPKYLMNFNPDFYVSIQITNFVANFGVPIFGSERFIEDLISCLSKYYFKRIPSKFNEIKEYLKCYCELLKISKGKSLFEVQLKDLKEILIQKTSRHFASVFLEHFCYDKDYKKFPLNYKNLNPNDFIDKFYNFLKCGSYYHFGKVVSGVFWIWRSLQKYFETLHKEKEYRQTKGALLEEWVYQIVKNYGFQPEKIILTNQENNPLDSHYYKSLKNTIQNFPKKPLEFEVEFPDAFKNWYFIEIDIAFRVDDCLFMIECKATSVPRSEEPNVIWWAKNFFQIIERLKLKGDFIEYNLQRKNIQSSFLIGLEKYVPIVINTEGLVGYSGLINTLNLILYLGILKSYVDKGELHKFLIKYVWEYKQEDDKFRDGYFRLKDILYKFTLPIWTQIQEDPRLQRFFDEDINSNNNK